MSTIAIELEVLATAPEPFLASFRQDLWRLFVYQPGASLAKKLFVCAESEGVWALLVYRFGRALRTRRWTPLVAIAWAVYRALSIPVRLLGGIHLDIDARIAPGFYVGHCGGVFIGPGVRIGANCSISQLCYVGAAGQGAPGAGAFAPTIGERVYLGPGSKVMGEVHVGSDAAVGANAVVLDDVPPHAVVLGGPARVVSMKGSAGLIYLGEGERPGSVSGEARQAAAAHDG